MPGGETLGWGLVGARGFQPGARGEGEKTAKCPFHTRKFMKFQSDPPVVNEEPRYFNGPI
jgi:hypothetical protein